MRVSEAMTREVRVASPGQSIREVAKIMAEIDAGAMPVSDNDRLVGMVTDRDIAIRAVAQGTEKVLYCYEDEDLAHVAQNMSEQQVRRLPVVNRDKRLVGIVSLGDMAQNEARSAGKAVKASPSPAPSTTRARARAPSGFSLSSGTRARI